MPRPSPPPPPGPPRDEVRQEVFGAKAILEDLLGQRVGAFCYPDGDCDRAAAAVVREAGFDVAFTTDLGAAGRGADPHRLPRMPVLTSPRRSAFAAYLSGRRFVPGALLLYWKLSERVAPPDGMA